MARRIPCTTLDPHVGVSLTHPVFHASGDGIHELVHAARRIGLEPAPHHASHRTSCNARHVVSENVKACIRIGTAVVGRAESEGNKHHTKRGKKGKDSAGSKFLVVKEWVVMGASGACCGSRVVSVMFKVRCLVLCCVMLCCVVLCCWFFPPVQYQHISHVLSLSNPISRSRALLRSQIERTYTVWKTFKAQVECSHCSCASVLSHVLPSPLKLPANRLSPPVSSNCARWSGLMS